MNNSAYFIRIAPDLLTLTLQFGQPEEEAPVITSGEALQQWCTDNGIIHGLDPAALAASALLIDQGEALPGAMLLAAGTPPVAACTNMRPCCTPLTLIINAADEKGEIRPRPLTLVPLVRPGTILIESTPPKAPQPGIDVFGREIAPPPSGEQRFIAGDLVADNQARQCFVAQASGYPRLNEQKKGSVTQVVVSIDKLIQVSTDKMQAMLSLRPPLPGHPRLDRQTVGDILDEEGIVFGRLPNATAQCLQRPPGLLPARSTVIALGTLPVKGKDAWLRFIMDVGPLPGKIMGNGAIDFRERNMFIGVDKDQLIAVRMPPTEGVPGRDVFGTTVPQTPGRDITIKVTDDAVFDPESGEIRAGRAGVLSMVCDHSVKVSSRQVIGTDVDFATGNLISRNALEIKGSVKPKFRVNALGDILIHGNVEKSRIRSDSNVVIRSGMLGEQATVRARGEVDISFIEHGSIIADGSIIVRNNAYFCRLHSNANLCCDPSSRIITSQLVAGGSITAGTVGSNNADPSLLAAAVCPQQWQQYIELQKTIAQQEYIEKRLRMKIGPKSDSEELEDLVNALQENKRQLARLNLILPESAPATDTGLAHALACRITITGKVFAGTEIRIGNSRMVLPVGKENICFFLRNPGTSEQAGHLITHDIITLSLKN